MHRVPTTAMIAVSLTAICPVSLCHCQFYSSRLRLANEAAMNMTDGSDAGLHCKAHYDSYCFHYSTSTCTESLEVSLHWPCTVR